MSKVLDAFIHIVHSQSNPSFTFEFIHFHALLFTFSISENDFKGSWSVNYKISGSVLVSKGMSSNDNWLFPSWNQSWNVANDDRLSEYSTIENISDGSVWTFPHVFKVEFFDSGFIRSDGSAFYTNFAFFDCIGSIDGDLVVGGISVLNTKIKVFDI